jgi:ribonuclease PH
MARADGRAADGIRKTTLTRQFSRNAAGSVLIETGGTRVICTASVVPTVPDFLVGKGRGWLTAEYNMLPNSTQPRKPRDRSGKVDGRNVEIQRLIGRSLRNVARLERLGERTLYVDCDVLDADGGTRTASITGAFVAAVDALGPDAEAVFADSVAAVSVGIVAGESLCDLDYLEDSAAGVDMNFVVTGAGRFVEVQGCGERVSFDRDELEAMIALGLAGSKALKNAQRAALGDSWRWGE